MSLPSSGRQIGIPARASHPSRHRDAHVTRPRTPSAGGFSTQIRKRGEHGDDAMSRALLAHVLHRPPLLAYARAALCPVPNLFAFFSPRTLTLVLFLPLGFAARGVALAPEDCSPLASTLSVVSIAARPKRLPAPPRRRLLLRRGSMSRASLHVWCST